MYRMSKIVKVKQMYTFKGIHYQVLYINTTWYYWKTALLFISITIISNQNFKVFIDRSWQTYCSLLLVSLINFYKSECFPSVEGSLNLLLKFIFYKKANLRSLCFFPFPGPSRWKGGLWFKLASGIPSRLPCLGPFIAWCCPRIIKRFPKACWFCQWSCGGISRTCAKCFHENYPKEIYRQKLIKQQP